MWDKLKNLKPTCRTVFRVQHANNSATNTIYSIPAYDTAWFETTTKKSALKMEKLDIDLKSSKTLSIKDCIRLAPIRSNKTTRLLMYNFWFLFLQRQSQEELADHFLDTGDLTNALKCYSRARDYCSSSKYVLNMCFNVIKVRVDFWLKWQWSNNSLFLGKV